MAPVPGLHGPRDRTHRWAAGGLAAVLVGLGSLAAGGIGIGGALATPAHAGVAVGSSCALSFTVCYITLSNSSGSPGNRVNVTGVGFYPGEPYNVYFRDGPPGTAPQLVASGTTGVRSFSARFSVPHDVAGPATVYATDPVGDNQSAAYSLTRLVAAPGSGAPGNTSRFRGEGFLPNATITFRFNGKNASTVAPCRTNSHGNFSGCRVTVPHLSGTPKECRVTATDGVDYARMGFRVT